MSGQENLKIAWRALTANLLRSALTMLGIVIGVGSVIAMVAFATGAQHEIEQQIQALGSRILIVTPQADQLAGESSGRARRARLTSADAEALVALPLVAAAAPVVQGRVPVVKANRAVRAVVEGTTPGYFLVRDWNLAAGRMFSSREQTGAVKVAILGHESARQLFGPRDPVGQQVRILTVYFEVIAVLEKKGAGGTASSQDLSVFVPLSTARKRLIGNANAARWDAVDFVVIKASPDAGVAAAAAQVRNGLRRSHRIPAGRPDDFSVSDPAAMLSADHAVSRTAGWLLAGIASVSLLVGGIGIMNIMLVSVTERTREIGLRIAIGASPARVRAQFLIEAVILCLAGGAAGLAAGAAAAIAAGRVAGWPVQLDLTSVAGAILLSSLVGLIFGYVPARRASKMDPVQALRTE